MADTTVTYLDATAGSHSQTIDRIAGEDTPYLKATWGPSGTKNAVDLAVGKALPVIPGNVSHAHLVTAASTNATVIKGSAGTLRSVHVFNNAGYPVYVKFHNTSGAPTPGTGVVLTVGVQAGASRDVVPQGSRAFTTGIGMSVVKGITDADATAVALSDAAIEVFYE